MKEINFQKLVQTELKNSSLDVCVETINQTAKGFYVHMCFYIQIY